MPISSRVARHLRANVIAYLALFVALGGSAIALPGKKTVKGDDLANGAVKTRAIGDGKVTEPKLAPGAVSAAKLLDGAVQPSKLANGAVTSSKIADGSVTSPKLADGAVVRAKIAQGEVTGGKIDAAAVSTPKLAGDAVTTAKVAPATLEASDFAAGQISDGFAVSQQPDLVGATTLNYTTNYNAPRAGRLLVTATTFANVTCNAICFRNVGVFVDGALVPATTRGVGTSITAFPGNESRDLDMTGVIPVTAGPHTIEIRYQDNPGVANGSFYDNSISGVLLQGN